MNRFHFINSGDTARDPIQKMKIEELAKTSSKVLFFQDVKSYSEKIKSALSR
jgi:hypothetical protein